MIKLIHSVFFLLFTEIILDQTISVVVGSLTGNLGKVIFFIPRLPTILCNLKLLKTWKIYSSFLYSITGFLLLTISVISTLFCGSFLFSKESKADKEVDHGLESIFTESNLEIKEVWLNSVKTSLNINDKYKQELTSNVSLASYKDIIHFLMHFV